MNEQSFSREKSPRDWVAIHGTIGVYVFAISCGLAVWQASESIHAIRELRAETSRLNQRMNADATMIDKALRKLDQEQYPDQPEVQPQQPRQVPPERALEQFLDQL